MRTKKVTKNLIISTILTTLVALVGLVKTKTFLKYLGPETTGVYQLFSQILSYISLVNAGLTNSLLYSLFDPVNKNDVKQTNSVLKAGRNFYNIVAALIVIIGVIVSFNISFFLKDCTLPTRYVQICFILFVISSAINYFVTARKSLIEAQQNIYKVHSVVYGTMIAGGILEIILLLCHLKLMSLMILMIIISIIQNIIIIIISNKDFPQLSFKNIKSDNTFIKQAENLFVEKISSVIFNNIDIILVSKFIGTASVVIYTSYMYVINSLQNIIARFGSSSLASIGNLLVLEKEKAKKIFYEYNSLSFYIANIVCVPLLLVITPFVKLFFGKNLILSFVGSLFVVLILYCKIIEIPLNVYNTALGYFDKTKKCAIYQSVINLILSIALLFKYGIPGILFATIFSYITGSFIMYPIILNKNYFHDKIYKYYFKFLKFILIAPISYFLTYILIKKIEIDNMLVWFETGILSFIINFIIVTIYFVLAKETSIFRRIKYIFKKEGKVYEKS